MITLKINCVSKYWVGEGIINVAAVNLSKCNRKTARNRKLQNVCVNNIPAQTTAM